MEHKDKCLNREYCLDKGEVALLAVFGDDALIADTARVSYRKGTKQTSSDAQLIRYLIRNEHTSPLEHASVRLYIKAPLFVIQQMLRHRTFKVNQSSARYSQMLDEAYLPLPEDVTTQDAKNKQARTSTTVTNAQDIVKRMEREQSNAFNSYNSYLQEGVAREVARINVPHGTYSELIVTADLHNFLHFLRLRLHPHAQYEIRVYAEAMMRMVEPLFPAVFSAWKDCRLNSFTLTGHMQEVLSLFLDNWGIDRENYGFTSERTGVSYAPSFETVLKETCNRATWASQTERAQFEQWVLTKIKV
jgi:thymidylate synthase (FAD)